MFTYLFGSIKCILSVCICTIYCALSTESLEGFLSTRIGDISYAHCSFFYTCFHPCGWRRCLPRLCVLLLIQANMCFSLTSYRAKNRKTDPWPMRKRQYLYGKKHTLTHTHTLSRHGIIPRPSSCAATVWVPFQRSKFQWRVLFISATGSQTGIRTSVADGDWYP